MRKPTVNITPMTDLQQTDQGLLQAAFDDLCKRLQQEIAANHALPSRYPAVSVPCDNEFEELVGAEVSAIFAEAGYAATFRKDVIPYGSDTPHSDILVTGLARIQWLTPGTHVTNATIISAAELVAMDEPFLTEALDRLCAEMMLKLQRNVAPADGIRYSGVSVRAVTRWERAVVVDVADNFKEKGYQVDVEKDQYDDGYYDLITVRGLDLKQSS